MNILKNILISVACFILCISVFAIYIPIEEKSAIYVFAFSLQLIAVYIYNTSKSDKKFIFFSVLLLLSNAVNMIIYIITLMQTNSYKPQGITDGLGNEFTKLGCYILIAIQLIILIAIIIQFFVLQRKRHNKTASGLHLSEQTAQYKD